MSLLRFIVLYYLFGFIFINILKFNVSKLKKYSLADLFISMIVAIIWPIGILVIFEITLDMLFDKGNKLNKIILWRRSK